MAIKIELSPLTLDIKKRVPGYALLKISGWNYLPELSEFAVQRNQDEKYLGENRQWEPDPVWHPMSNMSVNEENQCLADILPGFVDPLLISPNDSYRILLRSDSTQKTGILRIAGGVFASNAAGETPDSSNSGGGLITGDISEVEPQAPIQPLPKVEPETELEPKPKAVTLLEPDSKAEQKEQKPQKPKSSVIKWVIYIFILIFILLVLIIGALWFTQEDSITPTKTLANSTMTPESPSAKTDLELLQKFIKTAPTTDQVLAQAEEWESSKHCDAMQRLLVYSAHKTKDPKVALAYAKKYDPTNFQSNGCIAKPEPDTAIYWYQQAAESGNVEAEALLKQLNK